MAKRKTSSQKRRLPFSLQLPLHWKKWTISGGITLLFFSAMYYVVFAGNTRFNSQRYFFYVHPGMDFSSVADTLSKKNIIRNSYTFRLYAGIAGSDSIQPGLYGIKKGAGNFSIVRALRNEPLKKIVKVKIPEMRSRSNLLTHISKQAGVDVNELFYLLLDTARLSKMQMDKESVYSIFIPGTFILETPATAESLLDAVYDHYQLFWNDERLLKADEIGLTPQEATTLASIVFSETKYVIEMPLIAGVYMNRLETGMKLQSDPTLVFAHRKFWIQRVRHKHKRISSKYNTYRHAGLPPGPISTVPGYVIDAVLYYAQHDYMYFCARTDGSGKHLFARNYKEHKKNANAFAKSMNRKKIY